MTFAELNARADQRARDVQPATVVAVMMDRSTELIVALLGILKAGAAYLPIDPATNHYAVRKTPVHPLVLLGRIERATERLAKVIRGETEEQHRAAALPFGGAAMATPIELSGRLMRPQSRTPLGLRSSATAT